MLQSNNWADLVVLKGVNRVDKHELPKRRIAARLRRLGLTVRTASTASGYDLIVNGDTRVTLRVAFPSLRRHRVAVAGRQYQYRYKTWHFNFHHHGKLKERYTDVFVCLAVNPQHTQEEIFVIPWDYVTGKTFSLHGGKQRYAGRYAAFRNRWRLIASAGRRTGTYRRVAVNAA
jgi:hypothetical protein